MACNLFVLYIIYIYLSQILRICRICTDIIYLSQILRICRICTDIKDFYLAITKITHEFLLKGFNKCILCKYFVKFIENYEVEWCKFGVLPQPPTIFKIN